MKIVPILGMAAAYFVVGKASLLLAIPPGYAAPLWPAAGIALAGLLLVGRQLWPGILIGSVFVNLGTSLDTSSAYASIVSLLGPAAIGMGAVVQARLGAYLVLRAVEWPISMERLAQLVVAMVLGGPVSCLVSATVGVAALLLSHAIPWSAVSTHWWTWWLGDTVGVIVVAPLLSAWSVDLRRVDRRVQSAMALPVLIACLLSVLAFIAIRSVEWERTQLRFQQDADYLAEALSATVRANTDAVHSVEGLFAASERVEPEEYRRFARRALTRCAGIQALEWIPRVAQDAKDRHEEETRRQGWPDYRILEWGAAGEMVPARQRAEYFPVRYVMPYRGNEAAMGFDLASDSERHGALVRARDTGREAATGRVSLVQPSEASAGVLLFVPVYRGGEVPEAVDQRRDALSGYALGVFRVVDLVTAALAPFDRTGIRCRIFDASAPVGERLLYADGPAALEIADGLPGDGRAGSATGLRQESSLLVGGRRWTVSFTATSAYLSSQRAWGPWAVLSGGLLFTSFLGTFLFYVAGRTAATRRAENLQRGFATTLRRLATGHDLPVVLDALILTLEYQLEGRLGSVLLVDDQDQLRHGAAPSLPGAYKQAIDRIVAGSAVSSAEDPGPEPPWAVLHGVAGSHGLQLCWSRSIVSANQRRIGIFAVYSRSCRTPTNVELTIIESAANLARVAIEGKQSESQLQHSEERFRNLVRSAPDAIVITDSVGRITLVNQRGEEMFGYQRDQLVGEPHDILVPEGMRARHAEHRARYAATPSIRAMAADQDLRARRSDGVEFPVEVSLSPLGPNGNIEVIAVVRDVTERRQTEHELTQYREHLERLVERRTEQLGAALERAQQADRLKSAFLASMSHELRTPLNSIIGFTSIILQGLAGPLNDEQTKQLGMVRRSARHLLSLINDVLDISKIEAGQVEIRNASFDLRQSIEKTVQSVKVVAEQKGLELVTEISDQVGFVVSDQRRVEQILINLVNNAIKFTEKGSVCVACEHRGGALITRVTDTGIGIRPEDTGKLFQTFQQIDVGLARQHEGTGLGLAICKKLAGLLGGEITLRSEFGRGSTFSFCLPIDRVR